MKWKDQSLSNIEKLRNAIDSEFEYFPHNLSEKGFKNEVKKHMKTERSKMKGWFQGGKIIMSNFHRARPVGKVV